MTDIIHSYCTWRDREGYVILQIGRKKFREHRWVMEQVLGRPLLRSEVVHHKNEIRSDNRSHNLEVINGSGRHKRLHHHKVSDETRRKLSLASKGKPKSPDHAAKLRAALARTMDVRVSALKQWTESHPGFHRSVSLSMRRKDGKFIKD